MQGLPEIDVIFACGHEEYLPAVDVWIVIDVLRATTVITRWFELGGTELYPVKNPDDAKKLLAELKERGSSPLLMGEVNGIPPEGFDLGNSPVELDYKIVQEHYCAVMSTTNGTVALLEAELSGSPVLAASLRNASTILDYALDLGSHIGILCSGRKKKPCWEDILCAGAIIDSLNNRSGENFLMSDSAKIALLLWQTRGDDLLACVKKSGHASFLEHIGYNDDIKFACDYDISTVVPMLFSDEQGHVILRSVSGSLRPHVKELKAVEDNTKLNEPETPLKNSDPFEELLHYTEDPTRHFFIHKSKERR